jgi:hypothetical protein
VHEFRRFLTGQVLQQVLQVLQLFDWSGIATGRDSGTSTSTDGKWKARQRAPVLLEVKPAICRTLHSTLPDDWRKIQTHEQGWPNTMYGRM